MALAGVIGDGILVQEFIPKDHIDLTLENGRLVTGRLVSYDRNSVTIKEGTNEPRVFNHTEFQETMSYGEKSKINRLDGDGRCLAVGEVA